MPGTEKIEYGSIFSKISSGANRPRTAPKRGKYDFAVAYADPSSLPIKGLMDSLKTAMESEGQDLAIYPHPQGYPPLREFVANKLSKDHNITVSSDDIILGDGSSQPIHTVVEALIDPSDVVITENFVYSGTLSTLRRFGAEIRGVRCDKDGMDPVALEMTIQKAINNGRKPKLIYTIPTFQNPQGWEMTLERKQSMLNLSRTYGIPILEDDCYVDLRFDGSPVAPIRSLDDTNHVMYVGSFSKIIAPGMRLGYLTAPSDVLDKIGAIKSGGGVNQFASMAVHRYATSSLDDHVGEINNIFRNKRDAMLAALGENFGDSATWSRPNGGLFIWMRIYRTHLS